MSIDKLIEMTEEKVDLLKELKESLIYEECTYHVVSPGGKTDFFMLFDIKKNLPIYDGTAKKVKQWLERRKIDLNKVYNNKILN